MKLTSTEFVDGGMIPARYTCDGEGISPPLNISDVPAEAKTLVLLCDDPDAPMGVWDHWVVWNIPPTTREIPTGAHPGTEGMNSSPKRGYGPPCPPSGEHRYIFKLYALDDSLSLPGTATKAQAEQAMAGHILAEVRLTGRYRRPGQ